MDVKAPLPRFTIIAAVDDQWGLARKGMLPWRGTDAGKEDMKWFTGQTKGGVMIMGRKTWESISKTFRPLPDRVNLVIGSGFPGVTIDGALTATPVVFVSSFDAAVAWLCSPGANGYRNRPWFVIGGAQVYKEALNHPCLTSALITKIAGDFNCDLFFPNHLLPAGAPVRGGGPLNTYMRYSFKNDGEAQYLGLLDQIMSAPLKPNRTGVSTHSVVQETLKFALSDPRGRVLPLLTTKKVNWPAVYHELVWFLQGGKGVNRMVDTSYLEENGVVIWRANSTREFLDSQGLTAYKPGELGPVYGSQWRSLPDHDQLAEVIHGLQTDPWSRRLIVNSWNPADIPKMALAPCHLCFQFLVSVGADGGKELNCIVNMRSADLPLGVPFNIASYAWLTHMVSHIVKIPPGILAISMADCHIYENQLAGVCRQLARDPLRFPTLEFGPAIMNARDVTIDDFAKKFTIDDYAVVGYRPQAFIKLPMAI